MKKSLLTGLAVSAIAFAAPAATAEHPEPHYYAGGCYLTIRNDPTPNQMLGGPESWNGELGIFARTTDGGDRAGPTVEPISVHCDLLKNGVLFISGALAASGYGVAYASSRIQLAASPADVITVCEAVTVDSVAGGGPVSTYHCEADDRPPILPGPGPTDILASVVDTLNQSVLSQIDPTICPLVASRAPGAGPVVVNDEGDVYLFGDAYENLVWDCPPYETAP